MLSSALSSSGRVSPAFMFVTVKSVTWGIVRFVEKLNVSDQLFEYFQQSVLLFQKLQTLPLQVYGLTEELLFPVQEILWQQATRFRLRKTAATGNTMFIQASIKIPFFCPVTGMNVMLPVTAVFFNLNLIACGNFTVTNILPNGKATVSCAKDPKANGYQMQNLIACGIRILCAGNGSFSVRLNICNSKIANLRKFVLCWKT